MTETTMSETPTERLKGTVKNIQTEQGFMFVTAEKTGVDYFVHRTCIEMTSDVSWMYIKKHQRVLFTPSEGPKGPRAIEVRVYE